MTQVTIRDVTNDEREVSEIDPFPSANVCRGLWRREGDLYSVKARRCNSENSH